MILAVCIAHACSLKQYWNPECLNTRKKKPSKIIRQNSLPVPHAYDSTSDDFSRKEAQKQRPASSIRVQEWTGISAIGEGDPSFSCDTRSSKGDSAPGNIYFHEKLEIQPTTLKISRRKISSRRQNVNGSPRGTWQESAPLKKSRARC